VGSKGESRAKNKWDVSTVGQSAPLEVYLTFPSEVHQEERAAECHNTPVPGDSAECCSVTEIRTYCYFTLVQLAVLIPKPNHWISYYKLPLPVYLIHFNVISHGSDAVCTKPSGITSQKAINSTLTTLRTLTLNYHLSLSYKTFPLKKFCVLFSPL
jgi:hypothetical protein